MDNLINFVNHPVTQILALIIPVFWGSWKAWKNWIGPWAKKTAVPAISRMSKRCWEAAVRDPLRRVRVLRGLTTTIDCWYCGESYSGSYGWWCWDFQSDRYRLLSAEELPIVPETLDTKHGHLATLIDNENRTICQTCKDANLGNGILAKQATQDVYDGKTPNDLGLDTACLLSYVYRPSNTSSRCFPSVGKSGVCITEAGLSILGLCTVIGCGDACRSASGYCEACKAKYLR